ncbi:MAG: HU family DNA-binding protein [Brevinematia bacterium]|jgi:DNA-binding protein HU-beta
MNKKELVKNIAQSTKLSQRVVSQVIDAFLEQLEKVVKSKSNLSLVGYLTVGVKKRAARTAINPKTKQKITIPEKNVPFIKIGSKLKGAVK